MIQTLFEELSGKEFNAFLTKRQVSNLFVVTGKNSYKTSGAESFIDASSDGLKVVRFSDFSVNPKLEDVREGINLYRKSDCDAVVAIGGGSTIDIAKSIRALAPYPSEELEERIQNNNIQGSETPLIAIPTTSGTGSEATHFSVIYVNKKKYSLAHRSILPDTAILNHELTLNQPQYLTACVGFDALSQAIESLWSVNATKESQHFSVQAISLISENFEKTVQSPSVESRKLMHKGSYLAGRAINIAKTTAAHAMSYAFTQLYGIPHGHAVALSLSEFMELNLNHSQDAVFNKGITRDHLSMVQKKLVESMGCQNLEEVKTRLSQFAQSAGMKMKLSELGASSRADISYIVEGINLERLSNNPIKLSSSDLTAVVSKIW